MSVPASPGGPSPSATPAAGQATVPAAASVALQCVVTRPAEQAGEWVQALREAGLDAQALPLIDIAPAADAAPLHAAWHALPTQSLVMFVSANAVLHFFAARPASCPDWPANLWAGAAGPGTAHSLVQAGVPAAKVISPSADAPAFDTEALWTLLEPLPWQGRQVLVVRGDGGRDWLAQTLQAHGACVRFVPAYRRVLPQLDATGRALLARAQAAPGSQLWLFSSSEAVANLQVLAPTLRWAASAALATHARIAQAAREAGFGQVHEVAPQRAAVLRAAQTFAAGRSAPVVSAVRAAGPSGADKLGV